ncbi:hypothetical protein [Natronorubrum halophilum]|uniref:hypothetical protein n=1 Tax=Natronorubrum halophilum TaxID=1702106 RepID=UPI001484E235|nr:hypothetical protein [Natronorubrum halophilum]
MRTLVTAVRPREPHPQPQASIEETEDAPAFNERPVEEERAITDDVLFAEGPKSASDVPTNATGVAVVTVDYRCPPERTATLHSSETRGRRRNT